MSNPGVSSLALAARESGVAVGPIFDVRRDILVPGISHYSFKVRIGARPYEVIGVHRVVREKRPFEPARTEGALFVHVG